MKIAGKWRISELELWDLDDADVEGPAVIEFKRQDGEFRFVAVEGWMDCRHGVRDGRPCVEFTWEGDDGDDSIFGRGWAKLEEDGSLAGHIFIHQGDDSRFKAIPSAGKAKPTPRKGAKPKRAER